jgi:hypothetical protein
LDVFPLAQNYITNASCRITSIYQLLRITKGLEAEGLAEEAKVCLNPLFFASSAAPSSVVPGPP